MAVEQQTVSPNPKHLMDNQMTCSFIHNNASNSPAIDANLMPTTYINYLSMPTHPVEFQTSEACPKNFIIFDQNFNGSQVTFHPTIAPKFSYPVLDEKCQQIREAACTERKTELSSIKEDSDDIDALLMSSEEVVGSDDDEVSTGRTGSESPDSRSTCSSKRRNRNCNKTRNMVKMLKRIVPGGDRMGTAAVLDEAVKYLKSLKVEAMKIGTGNMAV